MQVDGANLPSISIVIPNYNGGCTLETTLQSLIGQFYPNLEILVVDGGSTDNSLEVIHCYESQIAWWVSEKDRGQSHAINKGFARATGEIVNWLCSDDVLLPGALRAVGALLANEPEVDVVVGTTIEMLGDHRRSDRIWKPSQEMIDILPITAPFGQPSCFYRRKLLATRSSPIDESYHFLMDSELWTYFRSVGARWKLIEQPLSLAIQTETNKSTVGGQMISNEWERMYRSYVHERLPLTYWHRRLRYPLERVRRHHRGFLFRYLLYYPYECAIIALLAPFYGFRRVRWMNWSDAG